MKDRGATVSAERAVEFWVKNNSCEKTPAVMSLPDLDPSDGTRVRRELYAPKGPGADVAVYAVEGGGHTWPGGQQYLPVRVVGRTSRDIDANEVAWEFFKRQALKQLPN